MPSHQRRAFTILELVLTLLLMAATAAVAMQLHFSRPVVTLQRAAELLAEDLSIARHLAAAHEFHVHVHFDDTGYRVTDAAGEPLIHPRTGRGFVRDYSRDAVFEGVELQLFRTTSSKPLMFDPAGVPNSGGEAYLTMGDDIRHVTLMPTGVVEVAFQVD